MSVRRLLVPAQNPAQASVDAVEAAAFDADRWDELVACAVLANEAEQTERADGESDATGGGEEVGDSDESGDSGGAGDGAEADDGAEDGSDSARPATADEYLGDPEDVGLLEFARSKGVDVDAIRDRTDRLDFLPFDSETKQVQALVRREGETVRYAKGAPEVIVDRCDRVRVDGDVREFTDEWKQRVTAALEGFSDDALRNLAFSRKVVDAGEGVGAETGGDVFLGAVGMWDPPREGVGEAVRTMYDAGIDVKMITGDSERTAVAVAEECGFESVSSVAWADVKDADDDELETLVAEHNVFARMDPSLKMAMVEALHRLDERVAITGDGVNDVPPIEAAEVGIAMGQRGSDITRDAADIILLDDAFPTIVSAIKYGRTVLSNVRKTVDYLLTANLFEVVVVFISALLGFTPFRAIQLLWVNFATDVFPAMALGSDPPHEDIMTKRPTGASETILTRRVWYLLVGIGAKKVVLALATFFVVLWASTGSTTIVGVTGDLPLAQTTIFVWLGLSHVLRIVAIRWDEGWKGREILVNRWVDYALLWPLVAFLAILYTPLAPFFQAVALPVWVWAVLAGSLAVGIVLAVAIVTLVESLLGEYGETEY